MPFRTNALKNTPTPPFLNRQKISKKFLKKFRPTRLSGPSRIEPMSRRAARGQELPPEEVELLNSLKDKARIERVASLFHAGWSLQAIGDSLSPRHPRSTIRSWVMKATGLNLIDAPIPVPKLKTEKSGYAKTRSKSPGISEDDFELIRRFAPLARTFRSRMASTSAPAVANQRLTELCKKLNENGVSVRELAEAAGVTYRAMYKRIKL